ncbi:MAG: ABC transporter permease [Vicinamibacterales bacterium]
MGAWLLQVAAVTALNLRTMTARVVPSLVAVIGITGVVGVFVSVLSMAEGFRQTMTATGGEDTAMVMRAGADSEMTSVILREDIRVVADAPGLRRDDAGAWASAELFVIVDLPKRTTGTVANVSLRGVQQQAFKVRDDVNIVEGRRFEPGRNEVIAGVNAVAQFAGIDLGRKVTWGRSDWTVVGVFDTGGTVADSEIWCDAAVLQPLYQRGNSFQVIVAKLESAEAFDSFRRALTSDPRLDLKVVRQSDYYAEQSQTLVRLITTLGFLVAGLMGIGAVFGAVNTMYSAVQSRTREIATLRALGFRGGPVVCSVLSEALVIALTGGIAGGAIAYAAFNGFRTSTINWQTFSQVAFAFTVTPRLIVGGIVYALAMGLVGGILPAIRAARLPVVSALREL